MPPHRQPAAGVVGGVGAHWLGHSPTHLSAHAGRRDHTGRCCWGCCCGRRAAAPAAAASMRPVGAATTPSQRCWLCWHCWCTGRPRAAPTGARPAGVDARRVHQPRFAPLWVCFPCTPFSTQACTRSRHCRERASGPHALTGTMSRRAVGTSPLLLLLLLLGRPAARGSSNRRQQEARRQQASAMAGCTALMRACQGGATGARCEAASRISLPCPGLTAGAWGALARAPAGAGIAIGVWRRGGRMGAGATAFLGCSALPRRALGLTQQGA